LLACVVKKIILKQLEMIKHKTVETWSLQYIKYAA
jgi:hypothetical protein